jgi:CMP-N,N'-diacetyllegionaminic acid synthase
MNLLALIPARGGSKGIPGKNIAPLGGRPLIAWTIEAAQRAVGLGRIVVSTDDDAIAAVARHEGAEVPFVRPAALAGDETEALPTIRHAVDSLDAEGWRTDAVIYLQPTSPFRGRGPIEQAVRLLADRTCDTVVSVVKVPHTMTPPSLMQMKGAFLEFMAPPESRSFRRQDKPLLYARNGPAVLGLTRAMIVERAQLYGSRIQPIEMGRLESHDIDDPLDLLVAEALLPLVRARIPG